MTDLIGLFDFAKGNKSPILEERESRPELQEAKLEQVVFMVMEWNFCNCISFEGKCACIYITQSLNIIVSI